MKKIDNIVIQFIKYLINNDYIDINNSISICKYLSNNSVNIRFDLSDYQYFYISEISSLKSFWPILVFTYNHNDMDFNFKLSYAAYDKLIDVIKTESILESLKKELEEEYEQSSEL